LNRTIDTRAMRIAQLGNISKQRALNANEQKELVQLKAKVSNVNMKPLVTVPPSRVRPLPHNELVPIQPGAGKNLEGVVWRNLGDTVSGRNWAMQALHPCGAGYIADGLPDTQCASVATPAYRSESQIGWDASLFSTPPATGVTTYNIQIVTVPTPEIDYMYRLRDVANARWSLWRVVRTPGYGLPSSATPPALGTTLLTIGYSEYRIIGKGHTFELNAGSIVNQGRVISGQFNGIAGRNFLSLSATGLAVATTPPALGRSDVAGVKLTNIRVPATPQFLVMNCPNVYQEEAKEGAYVVVKFTAPLKGFQFSQCNEPSYSLAYGNESQDASGTGVTYYPYTAMTITATDSPGSDPETDEGVFEPGSNWAGRYTASDPPYVPFGGVYWHPYVSDPDGVMTTCTFFEGLVIGNTDGTMPGATVRVKTRLNLECQTFGGPAVGPFIHPSPIYDDLAITAVAKIGQCAPDAYPASYNGLGDVLGSVWNWMKKLGKPVLTGMSVIPGIGSLANAGLAGMELADQFLGQVPVI
jgi:hypothetical protein